MSSTIPLCLKLNPAHSSPNRPQRHFSEINTELFSATLFKPRSSVLRCSHAKYSHICFSFASSNSSSGKPLNSGPQEEARWLREEQRWLREEQRWLRQESRWNSEREALLSEIQSLKIRIQELERRKPVQESSVSETIANIAKMLQVLKEGELGKSLNRILGSGSSALPLFVEATNKEDEAVVKEIVKVPEKEAKQGKKRATLRMGSEGDEVRAMQEALQKLGFYSGEEDMEYSSFSSGTERAVKTWQATLGAPEDGIMTAELLERLYMAQKFGDHILRSGKNLQEANATVFEKKDENGTAVASVSEISEVKETVVTEGATAEVEISEHRVYLLGENRWEEPSRLGGRNKQPGLKIGSGKAMTKCLSCRGEGRLLCMECDGTGEANIEPQFIEWVENGDKCPYCDGIGYVTCDVCEGRKVSKA